MIDIGAYINKALWLSIFIEKKGDEIHVRLICGKARMAPYSHVITIYLHNLFGYNRMHANILQFGGSIKFI